MTDRTHVPRLVTALLLVAPLVASTPTRATDWNAVSKGLNQMGQQLQNYSAQQRRQEQEQERQRLQQEQLELQRQKLRAAETERQQARQQVQDAEQRVLQSERTARAETETAKRVAEQMAPEAYSGHIAIHRNALDLSAKDPLPLMTIPNFAWFSPDGSRGIWIDPQQKTLKLWDISRNSVRGIATPPGEVWSVHFVGNDAVAVEVKAKDYQASAHLIDLDGRIVRSWPANTHVGFAGDQAFSIHQRIGGKTTRIGLVDAKGQVITELDVRGLDVEQDYTREDGFHAIALKGQDVHYLRNGQLIRQFSGDSRRHPSNEYQTPHYSLVFPSPNGMPYAVSTLSDDNRFMLWDLAQGRLVCSGTKPGTDYSPFTWPEGSARIIVHSSPPATVDPVNCGVQTIGSPGDHLTWTKDRALLASVATGRVTELDPQSFQTKRTIETGLSRSLAGEHKPYLLASEDAQNPKLLVVTLSQTGFQGITQLHDIDDGRLIATVPGWTPVAKDSPYVQRLDHGKDYSTTTRIWKRSSLFDPGAADFLKRAGKDAFETTDAWRKRVASLSQPHRITLDLDQYNADQGRFDARFKDVPMSLPLPPEVARTLAGAKTVEVAGDLKVLDADFFELANPKVLLPDGKTHAIVPKVCPKTLADVNGMTLRAYQHPRLATLRRQILGSSVAETLEKARKAGFDRQAAIAATREQFDQYADEALRIGASKDAAIAADLRNLDKLPLSYACQGPKGETVCRYIEQMWRAMAAETMAEAMACR